VVFFHNLDAQQLNLVCCHNDTLTFSDFRLPNYFKCLSNCECCMCLVILAVSCLLVLGSLEAIIVAQWAQ
jgi:hypothetical protein